MSTTTACIIPTRIEVSQATMPARYFASAIQVRSVKAWAKRLGHADISARKSRDMLFIYFDLGLRPLNIISLILSRVNHYVGLKREIPEKKHLTTRKLGLSHMKPQLGSNPQL